MLFENKIFYIKMVTIKVTVENHVFPFETLKIASKKCGDFLIF